MSFIRSISVPPAGNGRQFWQKLWGFVPLIVCLFYFSSRAASENDAAARQQTSLGVITECGHAKQEWCKYTFSADGQDYLGIGSADSDAYFGQTKVVYYDSQNPRINGLEDFSKRGRDDTNFACGFLCVLALLFPFVLYSNEVVAMAPTGDLLEGVVMWRFGSPDFKPKTDLSQLVSPASARRYTA